MTTPILTSARPRPLLGSAVYLRSHTRLLWRTTRNEIHARYAASLLGPAWVVLGPVLLLVVYGVVYRAIFQVRAPGMTSTEYVLYIFAGLVPYLMTAEALTLGASSVVKSSAALANTVFPIDLAPVKAVLTSLPTVAAGSLIVFVGAAATGNLHATFALVPVLVLLHLLALLGIVWFLSLVTVVFRDLEYLLTAVLVALLVASPIAYTPEMVPDSLKILLYLNPFAYFVVAYQQLMLVGELPAPGYSLAVVAIALGSFVAGARFFDWAKRMAMDYV